MQVPFAYSLANKNAQWSSIFNWEFSIVALVAAVMLLMISLALVNPQHGRSDSAGNVSLFSSSEFSSAVPIL
jgi:hypothetical protein